VERYTEFLGNVYMAKTWWVRDDGIGNEGLFQRFRQLVLHAHPLLHSLLQRIHSETVSCLDARPPCAAQNLGYAFSPLAHVAAAQRVKTRHQARIFDHEGHELGRVTANAEELQAILDDEVLEGRMCRQSHAMPVRRLQHLAQRDKGLYITPRSDDLYDDVERGRWLLSWCATKKLGNVGRRRGGLFANLCELALQLRGDELGQCAALLANANVDTAIGADCGIGTQVVVVVGESAWDLRVGGESLA